MYVNQTEFELYTKDEMHKLILANKCLMFVQLYKSNENVIRTLRSGLNKKGFRFMRFPMRYWKKASAPLTITGTWIPVSSINYIIVAKESPSLKDLVKIFKLFDETKTYPIFCKTDNLFLDQARIQFLKKADTFSSNNLLSILKEHIQQTLSNSSLNYSNILYPLLNVISTKNSLLK